MAGVMTPLVDASSHFRSCHPFRMRELAKLSVQRRHTIGARPPSQGVDGKFQLSGCMPAPYEAVR